MILRNKSSAKQADSVGGERLGFVNDGKKSVDTVATASTGMPASDFTFGEFAGFSEYTAGHC
jgi:hypothetical protein